MHAVTLLLILACVDLMPLNRGSGAINGDLGREVDGRWRSKGSPPDKHAQGSDRTPLVLK